MSRPVITIDDIRNAQPGGTLAIPSNAIVTDLARELAQDKQVTLIKNDSQSQAAASSGSGPVVAIGSDHGPSFPMKEALKPFLEKLGYITLDCGTFSPDSVDYPDIAYAVSKHVANGSAWRGIIIDGAGIGFHGDFTVGVDGKRRRDPG